MEIRNISRGARVLNRATGGKLPNGDPASEQFLLMPGATTPKDFQLVNDKDPVFVGMVEKGELLVDGKSAAENVNEEQRLAKERAELEKQQRELSQQAAEIARQREELKHLRNPMDVSNREAAMIAGQTPGVADPLPPGTDTKGGKESEEALKRAGVDPKQAREADPAKGGADAQKTQQQAGQAQDAQKKQAESSAQHKK